MRFKCVVFDANGILFDLKHDSGMVTFKEVLGDLIPDYSEFKKTWEKVRREQKKEFGEEDPRIVNYDIRLNRALKKLGISATKAQVSKYVKDFWSSMVRKTVAYQEVYEVLEELKGKYKLVVFSNSPTNDVTPNILKYHKLDKYFDMVVTAYTVGARKPSPKAFAHIASELNLDKNEIVMVGDQPLDVRAAKRAGVYSVRLRTPPKAHKEPANKGEEPDKEFLTWNELRNWLLKFEYGPESARPDWQKKRPLVKRS